MGWEVLQQTSGDVAIHAALVETANGPCIFYFDGVFDGPGWRLFHVEDRTVDPAPDQAGFATPGHHVMCSGHAFLADGRLVIGGGVVNQNVPHGDVPEAAGHDSGERRCYAYHPLVAKWEQIGDLNFQPDSAANPRGGGRWYPTLLTVATGEVLAVAGHPFAGTHIGKDAQGNNIFDLAGADDYTFPGDPSQRHNNNTPERYSPATNKWVQLTAESTSHNNHAPDEYPRVHLAPSGDVFFSTRAKDDKRFYDPYTGTYSSHVVPAGNGEYHGGSETTSVLLPILMSDLDNVWVLTCGHVKAQKINIAAPSPQWVDTTAREQWVDPGAGGNTGTSPIRNHLNSVILPSGEIFITGGVGAENDLFPQGTSTLVPEIYMPPIDWSTGKYIDDPNNPNHPEKWIALNDVSSVVRGYHSVALLMPDGAVFTAGSTDAAGGDNIKEQVDTDDEGNPVMGYAVKNEFRIEIFQPWYFDPPHQNLRPTVSNVPKSIGYGYTFDFNTPNPDAIQRVVLMRCGSVTHALDTDQRMISVDFKKTGNTTLEVQLPYMPEYMPPGRYMLWVVDAQNRPSKWAPLIRICKQKPLFSVDFDKFSHAEVKALGASATFSNAVYLVYDGFLPDEVTTTSRSIKWKDNGQPVTGIETNVGPTKYEGGAGNKDIAQRIVIPVHITFTDESAFGAIPEDPGFRDIVLTALMGDYVTEVTLSLTKKLNPRMKDGDPHWLSDDLRAFSTRSGASPFTAGISNPSDLAGAYQYIKQVVSEYDTWTQNHPGEPHPFDALPLTQENKLPIYPEDGNDKIFNFAVARVRYRAPELQKASDVRVFFRLWTTGWTAMEYSTSSEWGSYPRKGDGAAAVPLLGMYGGEVNTIPCFAEPRKPNLSDHHDDTNLKDMIGLGEPEVHTFYGCLLDFNQNDALFPLDPAPGATGPFAGDLLTIQEIMRGLHQCLVAEIHYWPDDKIPESATPASSDNIAQRNLLLDEAPNPGGFATHLVHHTFELKPSPFPFPKTPVHNRAAEARTHPDELVIDWGNLPRDSHVVFYMPQVDVDEVLRFAAQRQGPPNLSKAGDHAIRCKVTDVGFIPLPGPLTKTIAGLISVQLPPNLAKGEKFSMVLRQVDGRKLRVIGTTQFDIHIKTAGEILPGFKRNLSVLKHIALSIPPANRWYPVFQRYLGELGDRLRALGADPDDIAPSPTGSGQPDDKPGPGPGGRTGKIRDLIYDCFGDFEGFILEDCDGTTVFKSCERALEDVVRRACRDRAKVTVYAHPKDRTKPFKIVVHCC
jgi:hypothetical protein